MARIHLREGKLDEAVAEFEKAIALNAHDSDALLGLAGIAALRGNRARAEHLNQVALATNPDFPPALAQLADLRRDAGDLPEAIRLYREAIKLDDASPGLYLGLGDCLDRARRTSTRARIGRFVASRAWMLRLPRSLYRRKSGMMLLTSSLDERALDERLANTPLVRASRCVVQGPGRASARARIPPVPARRRSSSHGSFAGNSLAAFVLAVLCCACGDATRPNVVLYMTDTLRADALSCYGNDVVDTPSIDRLASEGVLFENAYSASSWTRASIASILTSTYPPVHGAVGRMDPLMESLVLLPEMLSKAGWATAGITSNPNAGSIFGFAQGYDAFFELYERRQAGRVGVEELTTTSDRVTEVAAQWIDQAREPFFLSVLTIDPHSPYQPPDRFDRYGGDYRGPARGTGDFINRRGLTRSDQDRIRSLYWGEVAFNDDSFGKLMAHLAERGLLDRTLVIFTSDHGEEFWEHGRRGHGKTLFEEVLRVPLILRLPGRIAAGRRVATPVHLVDVLPTVLDACGLPIPDDVEGESLLGDVPAARPIPAHLDLDGRRLTSLRVGFTKLIQADGEAPAFFDLSRDGTEREFIPLRHDRTPQALEQQLAEFRAASERRRAGLQRGATRMSVEPGDLSPDAREELRALGYLDTHDPDDR